MNLIQFLDHDGNRLVGAVDGGTARVVTGAKSVYALALAAMERQVGLAALVAEHGLGDAVDPGKILAEGRMLAPIDHPDPAHMHVTGTGLTHL
ncbi:MAG TPA: GguC protein, partial [Devosia sp.]|nr:GguC protein [Devosia sp.]